MRSPTPLARRLPSLALPAGTTPASVHAAVSSVEIPQYRHAMILSVWAAAALPMGALAWLVAPVLARRLAGEGTVAMSKALVISLTAGLVWQFALVVILVGREQRSLRWSTVREALWLRSPHSPRSGRVGGRVWRILIPLVVLFAVQGLIPTLPQPADRNLALFLGSDAGRSFFSGTGVGSGSRLCCGCSTPCSVRNCSFVGCCCPG